MRAHARGQARMAGGFRGDPVSQPTCAYYGSVRKTWKGQPMTDDSNNATRAARSFSIGDVLGTSFGVLGRNFFGLCHSRHGDPGVDPGCYVLVVPFDA